MNIRKLIYIFFIAATLYACSKNFFFQKFHEFKNPWKAKEKVNFKVDVSENLLPYQFFIDVRHSSDYAYQNLWLFITTQTPSNKYYQDTLELVLATPQGKWLGKSASGNIVHHHILFEKDFMFEDSGTYTFSFEQAMREQEAHIDQLGLLIQKGPLEL